MISIVTGNKKKYEQIRSLFPPRRAVDQLAIDIPEIQTTSLVDISADKCKQAFERVSKPVLVDDSGVFFDAFDQFPGALSKFIASGIGVEGIQRLYVGEENKKAVFQTVLSYMDHDLDGPIQFVGEVRGIITFEYLDRLEVNPKLPYDVIFQPDQMDAPAQTNMDYRKNDISHRRNATMKFVDWYGTDRD